MKSIVSELKTKFFVRFLLNHPVNAFGLNQDFGGPFPSVIQSPICGLFCLREFFMLQKYRTLKFDDVINLKIL